MYNNIVLYETLIRAASRGSTDHVNIARIIAKPGPIKNSLPLPYLGIIFSLENNLIASLNGCKIPAILTLFGPFRKWAYPKIFRSNKVIKATFTNTGINKKRYTKKNLIILTLT